MKRTVSVRIADIDRIPRIGEWCTRCLLPSGAVWSLLLEVDGAPNGVITVAVCMDCGAEL